MRRVAGYLMMGFGALILAFAFFVWISSDYPEISPFRFFGQFESGLWGLLVTQALWLRVVIIAVPGMALFSAGRALASRDMER